jgi:hypothetical protein
MTTRRTSQTGRTTARHRKQKPDNGFGAQTAPVGSVVVAPDGTAYQTTTHDTPNGSEMVVYRIS